MLDHLMECPIILKHQHMILMKYQIIIQFIKLHVKPQSIGILTPSFAESRYTPIQQTVMAIVGYNGASLFKGRLLCSQQDI